MSTRGLFCLSGISTYQTAEDLNGVPDELRTMRRALHSLGLVEHLPFTEPERSHEELEKGLALWANEPSIASDETTLVIYCTGHGRNVKGRYGLLTSDGRTWWPDNLVAAMGGREDIREIVFVLDVCFAEKGVDSALVEFLKPSVEKAGFWGVGSSRRLEKARQGRFATAFAAALDQAARPSWSVSHIDPGALAEDVNARLGPEQTVWLAEGHPATPCRALPNPWHQPESSNAQLPLEADWSARARGVGTSAARGFLFTGRDDLTASLREHLLADTPESVLVVTGSTGSGKSALLGNLVLTTDKVTSQTLMAGTRIKWPSLETRIAAGRGSPKSVIRDLIRGLGAAPGQFGDLASAVRSVTGRVGLVLDQLDEEIEPEIWAELLKDLAGISDTRIIVSLPSNSAITVVEPHRTIDLDDFPQDQATDVHDYLELRARLVNPAGSEAQIRMTATTLGERCGSSFEVAVAAADGYAATLEASRSEDDATRWAQKTAAAAAHRLGNRILFQRWGSRGRAILESLSALSGYGEGIGLPAREWAGVASNPEHPPLSEEDVVEAAGQLGLLVARHDPTTGLSRWRATVGYPSGRGFPPREAYLARLPQLVNWAEVKWDEVDPSVMSLLSHGAILSGSSGPLLDDPAFLLSVPPSLVSAAIQNLKDSPSERSRRSQMWHVVPRDAPVAERSLLLAIGAHRFGVTQVADFAVQEGFQPLHKVNWVESVPVYGPRVAGMSATSRGQGAAVVTIHEDDSLRFWDPVDGKVLRSPVSTIAAPRTVSVADMDGDCVALVSSWRGGIWRISCRDGSPPVLLHHLFPDADHDAPPLVALHSNGQVLIGITAALWTGDLDGGRPARRLATFDSPVTAILPAGPVSEPVVWTVTETGRIRKLELTSGMTGPGTVPFPMAPRPLMCAADADGNQALFVDVSGGLHLRVSSGPARLASTRTADIRAVALDARSAVIAQGAPGALGSVEIHDLTGSMPMSRLPVDEAAIGVAILDQDRLIIARPSGLLCLTRTAPHDGLRDPATDRRLRDV